MANLCREAALGPIRSIADIQCIEADQVPCYFLAWILRCFIDYFSMWLRTGQKVLGGVGPEHLEMWLIKNTWPTPSLRHKND